MRRQPCPEVRDICPEVDDLKAFKGKGQAWEALGQTRAALLAVWQEMERLAKESLRSAEFAAGTPAYIQVHRLPGLAKAGGILGLRWRLRQSGSDPHVSWSEVEERLGDASVAMRRYYWMLNQQMLNLNCAAGMLSDKGMRLLARMGDHNDRRGGKKHFAAWIKGEIRQSDFSMGSPVFRSAEAKR